MDINNIDKNGLSNPDEHVAFEIEGVTYSEWLTEGRCDRTDSQLKGLGFDSADAMEIHDFLDAALETLD